MPRLNDPRLLYDPLSGRWFAVIAELARESLGYLAVSEHGGSLFTCNEAKRTLDSRCGVFWCEIRAEDGALTILAIALREMIERYFVKRPEPQPAS